MLLNQDEYKVKPGFKACILKKHNNIVNPLK